MAWNLPETEDLAAIFDLLLPWALVAAVFLVVLKILEARQRSSKSVGSKQTKMDTAQDQKPQKGRKKTQTKSATAGGFATFLDSIGKELQSYESSSEDDVPSPIKAPKRGKEPQAARFRPPEDFQSWLSSNPTLNLPTSGVPPVGPFGPAHEAAEKGKNVLQEGKGACACPKLPEFNNVQSPNLDGGSRGFLPKMKQGATQGEDIDGTEPLKVFRTTQDGVLHVDCNVNHGDFNKINVFDSKNRGTPDKNVLKSLSKKKPDGTHPPKTVPAGSGKEPSQSNKDGIDLQKPPSSRSKTESRSPETEASLPKTQMSDHASTDKSFVLVLSSCQPAWEAQQYLDHACKDNPEETKALKKRFIIEFLQYRKEHFGRVSPYEDGFLQSVKKFADIPVEAPVKSAKVENKTTPVMKAGKASKKLARPGQCMFFSKLPPEIRTVIYRWILTTPTVLNAGAEIEKMASTLTTDDNDPSSISGIDSAVMRSCQRMYHETLPVLYCENKFAFRTPEQLQAFRQGNLEKTYSEISV